MLKERSDVATSVREYGQKSRYMMKDNTSLEESFISDGLVDCNELDDGEWLSSGGLFVDITSGGRMILS